MKYVLPAILILIMGFSLSACSPKPGSKAWCAAMKKKDKGDWTAEEVKEYAKHCML
ncbi:MAG: DUF3012 domain-containing protein [Gammaproteobacteria bacterium]